MKQDPFQEREAGKYAAPIASREYILVRVEDIGEPVSFKRLSKELQIETAPGREALRRRLGAMVRDGQLVADRRNVYGLPEKMDLIKGRVSAHRDGYGFLITDELEDDLYLHNRQMKTVFHGDQVLARSRGWDHRGRQEGEIVEVLSRNTAELVGRLSIHGGVAFAEPLNKLQLHNVMIPLSDTMNATDQQIVIVEITEQPSWHGVTRGKVIEILGDMLFPGLEVEVAVRSHGIPNEWPDEVRTEVDQIPVNPVANYLTGRRDLRSCPFITIDGEDARDFDDAVYCEAKKTGWRLLVAIADVSHFVEPDSPLDREAFARGNSVYFPQFVIPMIPEKLSNGICSLNPFEDRLCLVCEMTISERGRLSGYKFFDAVIRSRRRCTYSEAAKVLAGDEAEMDQRVRSQLFELNSLYQVLRKTREQRGALDFESTELKFTFDSDGVVEKLSPVERNDAHRIIEECMLCANVSAARLLDRHQVPGLFRVHDGPTPEKLQFLRQFLADFGLSLGGDDMPSPVDYQALLSGIKGRKNHMILNMMVLRSLSQAVYSASCRSHFGLSHPQYTHFTSPIRRYPDLVVHRAIKAILAGGREISVPYSEEKMVTFAEHCSMTERRADAAVYDVLEWLKCAYVEERVGDVFDGTISGVAGFGLFVSLAEVLVDGLVHVSSLTGDYYYFDARSMSLTGENSAYSYHLGDSVTVQISKVDREDRKIELVLISHTSLTKRTKPRRGPKRDVRRVRGRRRRH